MALILGIDIAKRSIRGVVVRSSLRAMETERYLEVPIHQLDPSGPRKEHIALAISELIRSLPSSPDSIVVCIEGTRASLRTVRIPAAARKRTQEILPFELESLLPFDLEEAVIDYQEMGETGGQLSLLAAAVPETVVAELIEMLATQEISPREIAVGAAALDALCATLPDPPEETIALVHLAEDYTDICFVRGGTTDLARTVDQGLSALRSEAGALHAALHQTAMKYRAEGGPLPSRVLVSGEGSRDPNLATWVGSAMGAEGSLLMLPPPRGSTETPSAVFGKAWALAARSTRRGKRIDLRRGKFALPRGVSQLRDYAVLAVVCGLLVLSSYVFSAWARFEAMSEERDALAVQLEQVTELHFGTGAKTAKHAKELIEGGGKSKDPLPRFDAFRALAAISASVPEGITHDARKVEVQLDEMGQTGKFEIQGTIPDLGARDQVVDALEENECINELEPGKISTVPGQDKKNYTLEGVIACPGAKPKAKPKRASRSN